MIIKFVYSTGRTETGVMRMLDGERRSLVILCPWQQSPIDTVQRIRDQLTDDELRELTEALFPNHGA
jgi:hypothetical protein